MALSRVKTWVAGEVLTASDLNAEYNNILDNALSLISPLTGDLNVNGNRLTNLAAGTVSSPGWYFSGDTNTGVYSPAADSITMTAGGVDVLRASAFANAVNFWRFTPAVAASNPRLLAEGTSTDINLELLPKGTGYLLVATGFSVSDRFYPGLALGRVNDGLISTVSGTVDLIAGGRRVLRASAYATATNYLRVTPSQAGSPVVVDAAGSDTNIGVTLDTAGTGTLTLGSADTASITAATAFVAASLGTGPSLGNTPVANALYRENLVKGWITFKGPATASIYGSYNVASLTRNAVGDFTITWDRDFAATPYALAGLVQEASTRVAAVNIKFNTVPAVGSVTIKVEDNATTEVDSDIVTLIAIGTQ